MTTLTAEAYCSRLGDLGGGLEARPPMRAVFALAKEFIDLNTDEISTLLDASDHLARVGAVSIMDFQARRSQVTKAKRRELYELYLDRHDRINTWDLVDRAAPNVVGGYLVDLPRTPLYRLAASENWWERRTAIVATYFFIRQGDTKDTFALGEILAHDEEPLVQKAVGGWIREAGKRAPDALTEFLDRNAPTMPRTALRYAIEKLDPQLRHHYLNL